MNEKEYQDYFNDMLNKTMSLLEVSGNEHLKKKVKGAMFDFSDIIRERLIIKGERDVQEERNYNR